jgi:hypothetical protein
MFCLVKKWLDRGKTKEEIEKLKGDAVRKIMQQNTKLVLQKRATVQEEREKLEDSYKTYNNVHEHILEGKYFIAFNAATFFVVLSQPPSEDITEEELCELVYEQVKSRLHEQAKD